jgi:hypothetical protein
MTKQVSPHGTVEVTGSSEPRSRSYRDATTDAPALDARAVALVGAAFSGVLVWFALAPLDQYASAAAKAFGL